MNIFEKTQGEKNSSFQKNSKILYQKLNLPEVFYPKFRQKSQNCFCFEPKATQKLNFLGKFSEKPVYHTKIQDNFHENNGRFAKTHATHGTLKKPKEFLKKLKEFLKKLKEFLKKLKVPEVCASPILQKSVQTKSLK